MLSFRRNDRDVPPGCFDDRVAAHGRRRPQRTSTTDSDHVTRNVWGGNLWRGCLARVKDRNLQQDFPSCTFVPFVVTALCPLPKTLHACRTASQPRPAAPVVILRKSRSWRLLRRILQSAFEKRMQPDYVSLEKIACRSSRPRLTPCAAWKPPNGTWSAICNPTKRQARPSCLPQSIRSIPCNSPKN